jgi:hypothetical protein
MPVVVCIHLMDVRASFANVLESMTIRPDIRHLLGDTNGLIRRQPASMKPIFKGLDRRRRHSDSERVGTGV